MMEDGKFLDIGLRVPGTDEVVQALAMCCKSCKNIWFIPWSVSSVHDTKICPFCGKNCFDFECSIKKIADYYGEEFKVKTLFCTKCTHLFGVVEDDHTMEDLHYCSKCKEFRVTEKTKK